MLVEAMQSKWHGDNNDTWLVVWALSLLTGWSVLLLKPHSPSGTMITITPYSCSSLVAQCCSLEPTQCFRKRGKNPTYILWCALVRDHELQLWSPQQALCASSDIGTHSIVPNFWTRSSMQQEGCKSQS